MDPALPDGAQAPGRSMTRPEKLAVARKLADLGVNVIEVGFPTMSKNDLETSKLIAREVGNAVDELGFVPAIGALARREV
ncbi:2-isopropylmalate synthase A [Morus notabilis]|uniref:2-isopropylmalate synthase A n=1 Tax=Morus notabilis TaxID=981085 RepID=W9RMS2_9ROSA|nr:2-isopropylmalate synthase A [Morus notabilis]